MHYFVWYVEQYISKILHYNVNKLTDKLFLYLLATRKLVMFCVAHNRFLCTI
jgi:hypothetical protein